MTRDTSLTVFVGKIQVRDNGGKLFAEQNTIVFVPVFLVYTCTLT